MTPQTWLFVPDTHFPLVHRPTFRVLLDFIGRNKIHGYVWGGDQFDNSCISHHTRGKPLLRDRAGYKREEKQFDSQVLKPIEAGLDKDTKRIWIQGNHGFWEEQLVEMNPEFDGLQRQHSLDLAGRGWKFVPCGDFYKHGKLTFLHGETLGGMHHAKKAVENYCSSVLYGHFHSPQSYTKIRPHRDKDKWMAYCSPILGQTNPGYLRNSPTGWLNGFSIIEYHPGGNFNVFPLVVSNGRAAFGGVMYGRH